MKKFDENYVLLKDMVEDDYYPKFLVEKVKDCITPVIALLESGVPADAQCMQGIGYKEVVQYLKNEISHSTMRDIIQKNTRNYAKRQITFFKKIPNIVWLDARGQDLEGQVMELLWKMQEN